MMGFGPDEARGLTYWEYTGLLTEYNERHKTDDAVETPDPDFFDKQMERLRNSPGMLH